MHIWGTFGEKTPLSQLNTVFICPFQQDVGGQDKIRPLWRHYYTGTQGLIFVVDCADRDRIDEARQELHRIINDREMRESLILVFANKQDLPDGKPVQSSDDKIGKKKFTVNPFFFNGTHHNSKILYNIILICTEWLFSSPEHEVLMVSYYDQSLSVVRALSTFCFKQLLLQNGWTDF